MAKTKKETKIVELNGAAEEPDDDHDEDIEEEESADAEADAVTEFSGSGSESDDDDEDADYCPAEGEVVESDEEGKEAEPVLEEIDKDREERLWNDFLTATEREAEKRNEVQAKPSTSKVSPGTMKINYEFAGEKVNISNGKDLKKVEDDDSWLNKTPKFGNGEIYTKFGGQREVISDSHYINPTILMEEESNRPRKRGGLSFLSGDPDQIGLTGHHGGKGGLTSVLAALRNAKKQKLGTLEKSRMDWESYKKSQGIEEELQSQIKSKNAYLDRQEFLQRADLRAFEIEKNIRAKNRRSFNPNP